MLKKKVIASLIILGSLLTMFVGTTLAYFVATANPLINTFIIGEIQIELTETTGADYALVPGKSVKKDPTVTVKGGSEACWLFVELRSINNFQEYVTYQMADGWTALEDNEGVYYRSVAKIDADEVYGVFKDDCVMIKDTITKEVTATINSKPKISVYAYAIQSEHVATATLAWELIQTEV